jgi:hypothetical protein
MKTIELNDAKVIQKTNLAHKFNVDIENNQSIQLKGKTYLDKQCIRSYTISLDNKKTIILLVHKVGHFYYIKG